MKMTAENCEYWQGEGCIALVYGIKCKFATDEICSQCNATDNDLVEDE